MLVSVELPLESWVAVQRAMKAALLRGGTIDAYPFSNQDFMHALAKIQLAIDGETL